MLQQTTKLLVPAIHFAAKLLLISFLFIACKQQDNSAREKMILDGMQRANEALTKGNLSFEDAIENLERHPSYRLQIQNWSPKLRKVKALSHDLLNYIDILIVKLGDVSSPGKVLQSEKGAHLLFRQLYYFKYNLVSLLDGHEFRYMPARRTLIIEQKKQLFEEMPVFPFIQDAAHKMPDQSYEQKWIDSAFANSTPLMCQAMLHKMKNDVLISAQKMMLYCMNSISPSTGRTLTPAIWFSASQVKPGDTITISAGLGEFLDYVKPAITIDGQTVESGGEVVEYKLKTATRPGKYAFPVHFSFTKYDGSRETMVKTFSYTVVQ